jgi:iron complex outermembrane recepter protein
MTYRILLFLSLSGLLIHFTPSTYAKGIIKGKITSIEDKGPVIGATVFIPDIQKGTATNANGEFSFSGLPYGTYILKVSSIGFGTLVQKIELIEPSITLNLQLSPSTIITDEVVISGGNIGLKDEIPIKIESFQASEIQKTGSPTLMTALTALPGIDEIPFGTGIGKPVIRGLSFSRVLTLYQGARFENQQWGEDHGLGLNDLGMDRIEIIKGPASLLYGSGAVAGVINLIEEAPANDNQIESDFRLSTFSNTLGMKTNAGIKGSHNGFNWGLRYGHENHADYIDGNNRTVGNSRFNTNTVKAFTGWQKSWFNTRLTYTYSKQLYGIVEEDEMEETLATRRNDRSMQLPFQDVVDHMVSSQSTFLLGNDKIKLNLAFHQNNRKEIEDAMDEIDLGLILRTSTYDVKYLKKFSFGTELTTGVQGFYQTNINMDDAEEILLPDASVMDNSAYLMANHRFEKITLQAGGRFDFRHTQANAHRLPDFEMPGAPVSNELTRNFSGWSGSTGLTYNFSKNLLFRTNLASGFRAPDLAELFSNGVHPGTNRFERGDANFGREQNFEIDLSSLYRGKNFSAEVAVFTNHINNYIYFSPTGEMEGGLILWEFLQSDALLRGGEIGLEIHPVQIPWLRFKSTLAQVTGLRKDDRSYLPLIPPIKLNNSIHLVAEKLGRLNQPYLNINLHTASAQTNIAADEFETPAYTLLGIGIGSKIRVGNTLMDWNLTGNNLLNTAYLNHLAVTRPFGIYQMGRNINFNLTIPLMVNR